MNHHRAIALLFAASLALGCDGRPSAMSELEPPGPGPHAVASTNIEVAPGFADIGDEAMHTILLGRADESGQTRFITDILAHPEAAWITNVAVPDEQTLYGPASGQQLSVVTFVNFVSTRPGATPFTRMPSRA